jgi:sulfur-carrier protein adenylyltransferase/sulfurtransferase
VEAIKLILGVGESLAGKLVLYDALRNEFTTVKLRWDPDCPVCGKHPTVTELIDYEAFCGLAPGEPPPEAERTPSAKE